MGSDRRENKTEEKTQIPESLRDLFQVSLEDLYKVWINYHKQIGEGCAPGVVIEALREEFPLPTVNYFTALGLDMVMKEYFRGGH